MSEQRQDSRTYFWPLLLLLFLFCLRVIGQMLVAFLHVTFLPPMKEWFSGLLPYPELLTSQFLIIVLFGKICLDFYRRQGYFVEPSWRFGKSLWIFGLIYLSGMVIRYVLRMSFYPSQRWFGGTIPIFFHWVLAAFLLVVAKYHRESARQGIGIAAAEISK
jgi:uncharacterized protein